MLSASSTHLLDAALTFCRQQEYRACPVNKQHTQSTASAVYSFASTDSRRLLHRIRTSARGLPKAGPSRDCAQGAPPDTEQCKQNHIVTRARMPSKCALRDKKKTSLDQDAWHAVFQASVKPERLDIQREWDWSRRENERMTDEPKKKGRAPTTAENGAGRIKGLIRAQHKSQAQDTQLHTQIRVCTASRSPAR